MSKLKYLALCLSLLASFKAAAQTSSFNELVWSDEFEGNGALNPAYWSYDLGTSDNGWGNRELQNYTNQLANVRQTGGKLIIEAVKQNGNWTSGRVKTQGKFSFTYGRVEWRARLAPGVGTWPALWMLGESFATKGWPASGEIDVMEYIDRIPGRVQAALHSPSSYGNTQNIGATTVPDATTAFHIYTAEWTEDAIRFYVDNTLYYTYAPAVKDARTWPFNQDFFLIMNIAVGGNMGSEPSLETNGLKNGIAPNLTSTNMEIDYVRVYQAFKSLALTGPTLVNPSAQNLTFKASRLANATYTWTLPAGTTIVSGQNTSEVVVNWGSAAGQVKVQMQANGQTYEKTLEVKTKLVPAGSSFLLEGFTPFPSTKLSSSGGDFQLSGADDALKVKFNVTNPADFPQVLYTLDSPLDMTSYPVLAVSVKTQNKSQSTTLRVDLQDAAGTLTGGNQVFNLSPLIDDGEYYTYHFNYQPIFGTNAGQVNAAGIQKIRLLVNYGLFGNAARDSLYVDNLAVLPALPATPNRASHLAASAAAAGVTLAWRDNSANEQGFKIFRSDRSNGTYAEIATLPANARSYTDGNGTSTSFYRIQGYNAAGTAAFSNIGTVAGVLTAVATEELQNQYTIYPNPAQTHFFVSFPASSKIKAVRLFTANGQVIPVLLSFRGLADHTAQVTPTAAVPTGLYLCEIQTENAVLVKRVQFRNHAF